MTIGDIALIIVSFLPGVFYLVLVSRYDRYDRGPRKYLVGVYFLGMFSTVPAAFLEMAALDLVITPITGLPASHVGLMVLSAFLVIGPVEETCKYLAVRSTYEGPHFNDPVDGVVYAVAAAMGFASLENAFYVYQFGWETFWLRAVLAIPGHLLFASMWGYQLGRKKFGLGGDLYKGLALAAFAHGLYDAVLFVGMGTGIEWLSLTVFVLIGFWLWLFRRRIRELWTLARAYHAGVPFGGRLLECESCRGRFAPVDQICPRCRGEQARLICSGCGKLVSWRRDNCPKCGVEFTDQASRCGQCRSVLPPYVETCPICGKRVEVKAMTG